MHDKTDSFGVWNYFQNISLWDSNNLVWQLVHNHTSLRGNFTPLIMVVAITKMRHVMAAAISETVS